MAPGHLPQVTRSSERQGLAVSRGLTPRPERFVTGQGHFWGSGPQSVSDLPSQSLHGAHKPCGSEKQAHGVCSDLCLEASSPPAPDVTGSPGHPSAVTAPA